MSELWIPDGVGRSELIDKKSRFIGEAMAAGSADEARVRVRELKAEHPRARHVAWAYVIGSDGALHGMSDDGEPHGTAGKPIFDPIAGASLTNTLVTVVRYFGGVKLGTGGLVSAYGRAAAEALEAMKRKKLVRLTAGTLRIEYSCYDALRRLAEKMNISVAGEVFDDAVRVELSVPDVILDEFLRRLADLSRGEALFERAPEVI